MSKPCDCIKTFEKKMQDRIKETVETQTDVAEWEDPGSFDHVSLVLTTSPFSSLTMPFTASYYKRKKDGTKAANKTVFKTSLMPTYCPICGIKIEKGADLFEESEAEAAVTVSDNQKEN